MLISTVDARDNYQKSGCDTCCCEVVNARPGETNLMVLNYAPWAVPLGGRGLDCSPQFDLQQMKGCAAPAGVNGNLPPTWTDPIVYVVPVDNVLLGDKFTDQDAADVREFALVPMFGPKYGQVRLNNGIMSYVPQNEDRIGFDNFFITVSDNVNPPQMAEIIIAQGVLPDKAINTPLVQIINQHVDVRNYMLSFGIAVSPQARPCDAFRLTIRQGALDCNYCCYWHMSCYDILIRSC